MSKEQSYQKAAKEILRLVGGRDNVVSAAHCATRLRLVLKDERKADVDGILQTELVKGQFANAGQFQIIIGSGTVDEVYKYFIQYAQISESTKSEVKKAADQKMNPIQKLVKMISDMFVPIIPALVASGLLMGLNNVLTASGLFIDGKSLVEAYPAMADVAAMINTFASAAYAFLPILIGFSAAKMFGANPYLGAVIGMIMISGDLLNAYGYGSAVTEGTIPVWNIFGLTVEKVGYQGTVLPVLAAVGILAFIEKRLHRIIPEALDNLLTPALSVLVTSFLTFTVVGGVMRTAGDWITNGLLWLHDSLGVVGGMIFGFIYAPLTMTGMHHSLLPVDIQLIAAGASFLLAIAACNNVAQGGATLAAMLCTKDKKMKSVAASSGISALLGITEPAMFGVNLKMKYPFYAAMVGSAVGCGYVTLTNVENISPGAAGIIGFICIKSGGMLNFLIGAVISITIGFSMTIVFSKMKRFNREMEEKEEIEDKNISIKDEEEIFSVAKGQLIPIEDVKDATFSQKILGDGAAVLPKDGKVFAPANGKVSSIFDTKHAVCLQTDGGIELLIHIGIDTVKLGGKHFKAYVKENDYVKKGQLLIEFDKGALEAEGYDTVIPVIVPESDEAFTILKEDKKDVDSNSLIMKIKRQL